MRLLAVRLQNLNSLSGRHEVRFDEPPLSAAGVFLICGPTGAGKSTLLDAMTLALYGRAARYGNDKAEEMMSRHTAECLAEVDFETRGEKLRATWRLRRARSKADGKLQPTERRLARADTGEILAEKAGEVDRIIEEKTGLDDQRFLRSVLLAQGQFAAFLKAKPNERAELLEKITGTVIYRDLSMLAHETYREKDEQVQCLKAALGALTVLNEEARAQLKTRLAEASSAAKRLQDESLASERQFQAQREHAHIASEMAQLTKAASDLETGHAQVMEAVTQAADLLERAKQQRVQREPVWQEAAGLAAQSGQIEDQLTSSRATYQDWAQKQREAAACLETAAGKLAEHLQAAQALEEWMRMHEADAELAEALPELRVAVHEWRVAHAKLTEGRKQQEEARSLRKKITEVEASISILSKQADETDAKIEQQRAQAERFSRQLDAQRHLVRQAELVASLDEHRQELKPGEPCPLCGSTEHPLAHGKSNFASQLQDARRLLAPLEQQTKQAQAALNALEKEGAKWEAERNAETKRAEETRQRLSRISVPDVDVLEREEESRREDHASVVASLRQDSAQTPKATQSGDCVHDPAEAEEELAALEKRAAMFVKQQQEATRQRGERQKLEGEIELARQDEAAKTKRLEDLKCEGVSLRSQADTLKAQLSDLLGGRTLQEDRQQHESRLVEVEAGWREAEAKRNTLQTQLATTKAKLEQLETRLKPFAGQSLLSSEALEQLQIKAGRLSEAFAAKRTELGALEQQLKHDDEARQRRETGGAALQAMEVEALRWGRLRELIGSADGAKFSRFAQSLTLRQLTSLANEHLRILAERYRLIAAPGDDLDLRIVDLFQANAHRPMESLSGGESFLASLALALGLSELASRHHPIDSLFIDEGFGTLDSQTLEIALSALENLRSRGKTIGLISHVDLLKERLASQVRVIRSAGGTSVIEVV